MEKVEIKGNWIKLASKQNQIYEKLIYAFMAMAMLFTACSGGKKFKQLKVNEEDKPIDKDGKVVTGNWCNYTITSGGGSKGHPDPLYNKNICVKCAEKDAKCEELKEISVIMDGAEKSIDIQLSNKNLANKQCGSCDFYFDKSADEKFKGYFVEEEEKK